MARDLYDILDIPENANDAWINRAYDVRHKAVTADASLSDAERRLAIRALEEAFKTLSHPGLRAAYDAKLLRRLEAPRSYSLVKLLVSPTVLFFLFITLMGAFAWYYQNSKQQALLRVEQERIASEAERANKEMEQRRSLEQERIDRMADNERLRIEQQQRSQFERERGKLQSWQRNVQYNTAREEQMRENTERRQRYEAVATERNERIQAEMERVFAQAEVQRQKRLLEQRERQR